MNRKICFCLTLAAALSLAAAAWACPACNDAVAGQGGALTQGFARSINLLMSMPYLLFAGLTLYVVRSTRRKK